MRLILIAVAALALSACATTGRVEGIPKERLVCPAAPDKPVGEGPNGEVTDEQNNAYLRALHGAWKGCWNDVEWLRDYLRG